MPNLFTESLSAAAQSVIWAGRRRWTAMRSALEAGHQAPRFDEVVDVPVDAIVQAIPTAFDAMPPQLREESPGEQERRAHLRHSFEAARRAIGTIIGEREFKAFELVKVKDLFKIRCCHEHWVEGKSWAETGLYEIMERKISVAGQVSGCRTVVELRRRYEELDRIFERTARERKLLAPSELARGRARDGIEVHLGPSGEIIFGGCGTHRLAMARALRLAHAPAVVGFVHRNALATLSALRSGSTFLEPDHGGRNERVGKLNVCRITG